MLHRIAGPGIALLALIVLTSCTSAKDPAPAVKVAGKTMGTTYHVTVVFNSATEAGSETQRPNRDELRRVIQQALDRVENSMSTWDPASELSRWNRSGMDEASFAVSDDMIQVVSAALEIARASEGAFDPTVYPLVRLWGFGGATTEAAPEAAKLQEVLQDVDYQLVSFDPETKIVRKARSGVQMDFSAIAKGYGADEVCAALEGVGVTRYMVEVGGEVRTAGRNPLDQKWRIGIDDPTPSFGRTGAFQAAVQLGNSSLATSGDYRNFRMIDGKRVSHTIDPRTGQPVTHNGASVSVVAPTCMQADAWATALNVLGPERGLELVETMPEIEAYWILRGESDQFTTRSSSGFDALLLKQ